MYRQSQTANSQIEPQDEAKIDVRQLSPELREVLHMLDEFEHHPDHAVRK